MSYSIKFDKCLPQDLTIESIDDILYRIGLSLDSIRDRPKRPKIFHPIIVFIVVLIFAIKEMTIFSLKESHSQWFPVLGSYGHLLGGIRRHLSLPLTLFSILSLSSQLIYYYNERNGIKPTFLRVFKMMSGLVTPKSIGLTDEQHIRNVKNSSIWIYIIGLE